VAAGDEVAVVAVSTHKSLTGINKFVFLICLAFE
jgi:hypothetical protein